MFLKEKQIVPGHMASGYTFMPLCFYKTFSLPVGLPGRQSPLKRGSVFMERISPRG